MKKRRNNLKTFGNFIIGFIIILVFSNCQNDYQPKPRGYFRIELPSNKYQRFQMENYPYSFDVSSYANIIPPRIDPERYWINIKYPKFNAQLHISYKPIHNNLDTLLNDVHKMMNKHIPKANAIDEQMYLNESLDVYGITYKIMGSEAASPYQFYLTDSTTHFLRGALYFNFSPNNDSLQPVIDFIEKDMARLIESFEWNQ